MAGDVAILVQAASATGVSPFPWTTAISVVASLATIISVVFLFRQARAEQRSRDADQRSRDEQLLRDFYGDQREGVPHRPGVLVSLENLDSKIDSILSEVTYDHGSSIKDGVRRIDHRLESVESDVKGIHERLDAKEG